MSTCSPAVNDFLPLTNKGSPPFRRKPRSHPPFVKGGRGDLPFNNPLIPPSETRFQSFTLVRLEIQLDIICMRNYFYASMEADHEDNA